MARAEQQRARLLLPGLVALALATVYLIALLAVEKQALIIALLAAGIVAVLAAALARLLDRGQPLASPTARMRSAHWRSSPRSRSASISTRTISCCCWSSRCCSTRVATLGLNIQFGYAGVLNFAGASFFGIGAYTSAVLNTHTAVPHLLVLLIGGLIAALIGSLLLLPVLRTRGHYAAVVTIAFALLLKTFLEVNDVLGGPQGMQVQGMKILGWSFNDNIEIGAIYAVVLHELLRRQPAAAGRRLRPGAAAGALLDRAQSRCPAARRDRGELLRPRHRALEDHRVSCSAIS